MDVGCHGRILVLFNAHVLEELDIGLAYFHDPEDVER